MRGTMMIKISFVETQTSGVGARKETMKVFKLNASKIDRC